MAGAALIDLADIAPYSMFSPERLASMVEALLTVDREGLNGDVVECGVWKGGNIILARKVSPGRICWLYDTFTGMTEPGPEDVKPNGKSAHLGWERRKSLNMDWCKAALDEVKANLSETGVYDESRLRFVVGDIRETLAIETNLPERIAVLRLDTDWYASTRASLQALYPRVVAGGFLIVDDWGHWAGARRAVEEYFGPDFEPVRIDYTAVLTRK